MVREICVFIKNWSPNYWVLSLVTILKKKILLYEIRDIHHKTRRWICALQTIRFAHYCIRRMLNCDVLKNRLNILLKSIGAMRSNLQPIENSILDFCNWYRYRCCCCYFGTRAFVFFSFLLRTNAYYILYWRSINENVNAYTHFPTPQLLNSPYMQFICARTYTTYIAKSRYAISVMRMKCSAFVCLCSSIHSFTIFLWYLSPSLLPPFISDPSTASLPPIDDDIDDDDDDGTSRT